MNLRDFEYLVALEEHGHFGRAAAACFVSQPALSMQIKKLEDILGIKLLERTSKAVILTASGALIAERARNILSQVEDVRDIAKSAIDPFTGEIKIGIFPTLAPYLLPLIIPSLAKSLPTLSLYLIEEQTAQLLEKLKNGKIHAAFLAGAPTENGFKAIPLFNEEYVLAVPNKHELSQRKSIHQKDLVNKELLLLEEGHCMRNQALAICQQMRAAEIQNFRGTSLETLRHMVAAGVGITLIPALAQTANKYIRYIPFSKPTPNRIIYLVWRSSTSKDILLDELVRLIKTILLNNKNVTVLN